jgi:tetratricopeptide (TPR) repeat protein
VVQFFMRDPSGEPALLAALHEWLTPFQALITFNGKSFDLPLLNTRFAINGLSSPFSAYEHLDLLHLARRLWRDRLASRAMGDLEKEIIGVIREQEDVPGYLIPQYYFDYLRTGDARPLEGIFYHNGQDIVSLAALFNYMASILEAPRRDPLPSLDIVSIARLYEELGYLEQAAELFERSLLQGLPQDFFIKTLHRFALLRRKQGNLELSVQLWQKAAEHHDLDAHIELAKYYEHQLKDIIEALRWSNQAMQELYGSVYPEYYLRNMAGELKKRIQRLESKVGQTKGNEHG